MASPAEIALTDEEIRGDVAAALRDQGYTNQQARGAATVAHGQSFADMFKSALEWLQQSRGKNGRTKMLDDGQKRCSGYKRECGEPLRPRNTNGLCTRCYARKNYHDKHGNGNGHKPKASAPKAVNHGRVALEVTEAQLDRFLSRLPLADKQMLANHYLQSSGGL